RCGICNHVTVDLRKVKDRNKIAICEVCDCIAKCVPSHFTAITDTNFGGTGKYNAEVDSIIEGRADYKKKLKKKGLIEVDKNYGFVSETTTEERIKKQGLQVM
ncbi:hypothetical protein LCGC14_2237030, partial [marine sediment metagenome]